MMRIPFVDGAENDALSRRAKRFYGFKPGGRKYTKRKYNKRLRRYFAREAISQALPE